MKTIMSYVVLLCTPIYMVMAMEKYTSKINLRLIDDDNKTYAIERWKVVQDANQIDVLNVPNLTEQQILRFDEELDEIDVQVIQRNDDALKLEIKKRIIGKPVDGKPTGVHFPLYKEVFDYFLISIITDNIWNNRVKGEKPFEKCGPIDKLKVIYERVPVSDKDEGSCVALKFPSSTMLCVGFNNSCDTCPVRVFTNKKNGSFGEDIGIVEYKAKNLKGLGVTTDLKYLVATFDNNLASKAALYSDEDYAAYKDITDNIKLADIYLLYDLFKAKKEGCIIELKKMSMSMFVIIWPKLKKAKN